jgi:hypothetical protein
VGRLRKTRMNDRQVGKLLEGIQISLGITKSCPEKHAHAADGSNPYYCVCKCLRCKFVRNWLFSRIRGGNGSLRDAVLGAFPQGYTAQDLSAK